MRGIAHRGGTVPAEAAGPGENTLAAFARAAALGLDVETDVHASADGVPVLSHDPDLLRVAGDRRRVADTTWRELARVRVGGEPLARLDDLLDALPDTQVNVDVKDAAGVAATVEAVRRVRASGPGRLGGTGGVADPGTRGRITVASFSPVRSARVRRALGHAVGWSATPPEIAALVAASRAGGRAGRVLTAGATAVVRGVDAVQVPTRLLTGDHGRSLLALCHDRGIEVHVWTVDDPAEIAAFYDLGVDAVMSDAPDVLAGVLAARAPFR